MKNLLNSVRLYGNVGKDPVITLFENGGKVARWSMATNERLKNAKGEVFDEVMWHQLVAWGNAATLVESFVKKGSRIAVEGKLTHRRFTNRDGVEKEVSEILVKDLLLLEKRQPQNQDEDEIEEVIPF